MQNLAVTWETVPGATHRLSLIDITFAQPVTLINNQTVTGGSFTIPVSQFTVGRYYRVDIVATVSGRNLSSSRIFTIGQILPEILSPLNDRVQIEPEGLVVTWREVPGATYQFTLVNRNTNATVIATGVTGTSFRIFERYLTPGHRFRIEVAATLGGHTVRSWREFDVIAPLQPPSVGITVTVLDGNGWPIQGAYVHFLRSGSTPQARNRTFRTNANGIAFYPNAPVADFRINVTHPHFVSNSNTSGRLERTNITSVQTASFVMAESSARLRSFGWANVLEGIGTRPYRISSVYGHRYMPGFEWHSGVDINEYVVGRGEGNMIFSAFTGEVVDVFLNGGGAGFGANVRFADERSETYYFMRYMHMQQRPMVNRISAGTNSPASVNLTVGMTLFINEHFGFLGNTGRSFGPHLHIDVHRQNSHNFVAARANEVDPRAFFAPGFVNPWPNMFVQP